MAVDARDLPPLDGTRSTSCGRSRAPPGPRGGTRRTRRGASMEMPGAGTEVAITVEPAGGSEQPTTEPIIKVDPASV